MPTINITEGCAHRCAYCYTQGYSNYPGLGRVVLFDNIPDLLEAELSRKRRLPRRVYFSPSSDAFQSISEVQEVTFQTMTLLLRAGIEVAFLTKGIIGPKFFTLFSQAPASIFAQIGITTMQETIWQTLEPGSASPQERLDNMERLIKIGVTTTSRLDPLIADVTDTEASLDGLLAEMARRKLQNIAASYLFLRSAFARRLADQVRSISDSTCSMADWPWQEFAEGVTRARMIGAAERQIRFEKLKSLASRYGIQVHVCTCKNPGLSTEPGCLIAGDTPRDSDAPTMPLFGEAHGTKSDSK